MRHHKSFRTGTWVLRLATRYFEICFKLCARALDNCNYHWRVRVYGSRSIVHPCHKRQEVCKILLQYWDFLKYVTNTTTLLSTKTHGTLKVQCCLRNKYSKLFIYNPYNRWKQARGSPKIKPIHVDFESVNWLLLKVLSHWEM